MNRMGRVATIAICLMLVGGIVALAADWELLGTRKVKMNTDRDVIRVGAKDGYFRAIKLKVRVSGLNMKDMKVHFMNGSVMDVRIRKIIPKNGETRVIDLPGVNRHIEKVVFWYESTKRNDKRATVRLWGLR